MRIAELAIFQLKHFIEALRIVDGYKKLVGISPKEDDIKLVATLENTLEEKENEDLHA